MRRKRLVLSGAMNRRLLAYFMLCTFIFVVRCMFAHYLYLAFVFCFPFSCHGRRCCYPVAPSGRSLSGRWCPYRLLPSFFFPSVSPWLLPLLSLSLALALFVSLSLSILLFLPMYLRSPCPQQRERGKNENFQLKMDKRRPNSLPRLHSLQQITAERIRRVEREKQALMLQVAMLNDQLDSQAVRLRDVQLCADERQTQLARAQHFLQKVSLYTCLPDGLV